MNLFIQIIHIRVSWPPCCYSEADAGFDLVAFPHKAGCRICLGKIGRNSPGREINRSYIGNDSLPDVLQRIKKNSWAIVVELQVSF